VLSPSAVEALRRNPHVKYITPDSVGEGDAQSTPTGVKRVFAPTNAKLQINEKSDRFINADIAILDSGIDFSQPDLITTYSINCIPESEEEPAEGESEEEAEAKKGKEEATECEEGDEMDARSHGTHVAGIAAAVDNTIGVVGVAPGARLASVKVINAQNHVEESWFLAGIDWVVGEAEFFEVANASLSAKGETWKAAEAAIKKAVEAGIVFVVSAGNEPKLEAAENSPAKSPDVITVGAIADYDGISGGTSTTPPCPLTNYQNKWGTEKDDTWANLSSWGPAVDVVAPGVCIYSTLRGSTYGYKSGTSMAAPQVAGAAAILASEKNPKNMTDVEAIRATIEEQGNTVWTAEHEGEQQPLLDVSNESVFK